jgi:uncharacterized protein YgbK (DUF1537 family)
VIGADWREEVGRFEPARVAEARRLVREANEASGRRLLVLDDDPTGSQSVHGVEIVMMRETHPAEGDLEELEEIARALQDPGSTCFVLTNSRSLPEADAAAISFHFGRVAIELERRFAGPVSVVSRSDSTLRGHLLAEVQAIDEGRRAAGGRGYDGVLLVPAYLEAGRFTAADVQWARVGDDVLPVGRTEFAKDATFGYVNSDLRCLLEEKSGGAIRASAVASVSLEDLRSGGCTHVAEVLGALRHGRFAVVNAADDSDLEIAALGVVRAEEDGASLLVRSGPSFVAALAGVEPVAPLGAKDIWPAGRPAGHGIVVVGSHVALTNRQVEALVDRGDVVTIVVDCDAIVDSGSSGAVVEACASAARDALKSKDVLLITSRTLRIADGEANLTIGREIATAVAAIVRNTLSAGPAWLVAKGGVTSHSVLTRGLGLRRAEVVGQLFAGFVSLFRPLEADTEALEMPCVVFAGNVGDDGALADVVAILRGDAGARPGA